MFINVNNKPTFMFDVNGIPTPGTWTSNGTLIVPTASKIFYIKIDI